MINLKAFSFLCLVFLIIQPTFSNETVRITTGEWPPYISESLDNKGLLAQITSEAFALKGFKVELDFFPWARANELSKTGQWDGTIAYAHIKERDKFFLFSNHIYVGRYVLFHLKKYPFTWTRYEDLKNIRMSSTRGFGGMGDKFLAAERSGLIKVDRLSSDVQSFSMLLKNRVQAVPSDLEVGYVLLHKLYGKEAQELFTHNSHEILNSEYHLVISKKIKNGQKLIDNFNEGLKMLRKSGRYAKIVKTWYNKPIYKEAIPSQYLIYSK